MRYVVHISKADGAIAATLDTPEHFEFGAPVDSILFDNSILSFRAGLVSYEGSLSADSQSIQGTWSLGVEKQNVIWQRVPSDSCEPP